MPDNLLCGFRKGYSKYGDQWQYEDDCDPRREGGEIIKEATDGKYADEDHPSQKPEDGPVEYFPVAVFGKPGS